jgi:hypothetical protein
VSGTFDKLHLTRRSSPFQDHSIVSPDVTNVRGQNN